MVCHLVLNTGFMKNAHKHVRFFWRVKNFSKAHALEGCCTTLLIHLNLFKFKYVFKIEYVYLCILCNHVNICTCVTYAYVTNIFMRVDNR